VSEKQNYRAVVKRIVIALLSVGLLSSTTLTSWSDPADARQIEIAKASAIKLQITTDGINLKAAHSKLRKGQTISYEWFLDGSKIEGSTAQTTPYDVNYCGKPVTVKITIKEKNARALKETSRPFNPKECQYSTGDVAAWPLLYDCGIRGTGHCKEYTATPGTGSLWVFIYEDARATTWLKVPLPEIDPSRISSYFVVARGVFGTYTPPIFMVVRDKPSWSALESFYGASSAGRGAYRSVITSGFLDPAKTGAPAYVGFDFYDPFRLYDGIVVDTLRVTFFFK
jgi:hypothetical protein